MQRGRPFRHSPARDGERASAREAGKGCGVSLLGSLKNIAAFLVESLRNWAWPEEVFGDEEGMQIRLDSS